MVVVAEPTSCIVFMRLVVVGMWNAMGVIEMKLFRVHVSVAVVKRDKMKRVLPHLLQVGFDRERLMLLATEMVCQVDGSDVITVDVVVRGEVQGVVAVLCVLLFLLFSLVLAWHISKGANALVLVLELQLASLLLEWALARLGHLQLLLQLSRLHSELAAKLNRIKSWPSVDVVSLGRRVASIDRDGDIETIGLTDGAGKHRIQGVD